MKDDILFCVAIHEGKKLSQPQSKRLNLIWWECISGQTERRQQMFLSKSFFWWPVCKTIYLNHVFLILLTEFFNYITSLQHRQIKTHTCIFLSCLSRLVVIHTSDHTSHRLFSLLDVCLSEHMWSTCISSLFPWGSSQNGWLSLIYCVCYCGNNPIERKKRDQNKTAKVNKTDHFYWPNVTVPLLHPTKYKQVCSYKHCL